MAKSRLVFDRFFEKVDAFGDCWEWTAGTAGAGYGVFTIKGADGKWRNHYAHRVVWELLVGPIPEGMEIDHRCFNIRCVNPDHLEVVTRAENKRRSRFGNVGAVNRQKKQCPKGHAFKASMESGRQRRTCRQCTNDGHNAARARNPEAKRAYEQQYEALNREKRRAQKIASRARVKARKEAA